MRVPKYAFTCDGCRKKLRARFRIMSNLFLCEPCYQQRMNPAAPAQPVGAPPASPLTVGVEQTAQTVDTHGLEDEFDLSHLEHR